MRDNQLTGVVPESLVKLPSLKVVNLTNNLLQGSMPAFDTKAVQVDMAGTNSFCSSNPGISCDPTVYILLSIARAMGYPVKFAQVGKGIVLITQGVRGQGFYVLVATSLLLISKV